MTSTLGRIGPMTTANQVSHTAGPWRLGAKGRTQDIKAQANVVVARVEPLFDLKEGDAESQANAKLIAAAPEMLEALREAEARFHTLEAAGSFEAENPYQRHAVELVRAAIAKATA